MNGMPDLILDPILPEVVVALLAAGLLLVTFVIYRRVGDSVERWRRALLLCLRLVGIALVVGLLLQPSRREFIAPPKKERTTLLALDTSLSMKQRDVDQTARIDAARNLLIEAEAVTASGVVADPRVRLFEFSADAQPVTKTIIELTPKGASTRINKSVLTILGSAAAGESPNALILLTDGHDFELVNPVKTGAAARARQVPIYAVPFGRLGKVRDVSARIVSFQPYCYVKQKARITTALRLIGCEFEDINVQLLRRGQVAQTKRVNAEELQELNVEFEVIEPEVGQYEYEVRVQPLEKEADTANNSAITYLNVIDQQIRVLVLEGDPYWDTTFLQRSLMRNDKFVVDALIRYGKDRVRAIRKTPGTGEFRAPTTLDQFAQYHVIVLGRAVDRLLSAEQISLIEQCVKERSGTVIFSRGHAFNDPKAGGELEPVIWSDPVSDRVRLGITTEGRALAPLRGVNEGSGSSLETLPDLLGGRTVTKTEPLTATLAVAANRDDATAMPAIVHRRYGRGQVVSVGVAGLWRWSLNSKVEAVNSPFDRFWDQMMLWLLAGRDFIPNRQFSFTPNSVNIQLGEKAYFRLTMRQPDASVKSVPLTFYFGEAEAGRASMTAMGADTGRLTGEFLPTRVGRYRALAKFPDGTTQDARFIVFTENLEETEVAADTLGLRRLCESSGGRLIEPADLKRLLGELNSEKAEMTPETRIRPVWNVTWVFYLLGLLFSLDWFLRRRWGLC